MHPVILLGRTDAGGREASMEKDMRRGAFLPVLRGLLAILISLGIGLGITWMMEWGAGWRLYATHRNAGLIWGPYSLVEHRTDEFSYQARINNLGFRDRDFPVRRSGAKRVIALGDSFTYGWGGRGGGCGLLCFAGGVGGGTMKRGARGGGKGSSGRGDGKEGPRIGARG